jgi:hypothetical protein
VKISVHKLSLYKIKNEERHCGACLQSLYLVGRDWEHCSLTLDSGKQCETLSEKKVKQKRVGVMTQAQLLSNKHESLSSNPSTAKKNDNVINVSHEILFGFQRF